MGMGTSAHYEDIIDVKNIKKFCPKTFKGFMTALKKDKVTLEQFAKSLEDEASIRSLNAYDALRCDFKKATGGLYLLMGFHEKEDRYDEVDGVYFAVGDMYQLTPAGRKHQKIIQRKFFTTWG
jgi:hypothetical protein